MVVSFTKKELMFVQRAVVSYIENMGAGEETHDILEKELEEDLSTASDKIDNALKGKGKYW